MESGLDTGPIFDKRYLELKGDEFVAEIRQKISKLIEDMIVDFIILKECPIGKRQEEETTTFYRCRTLLDSEIDPQKTLVDHSTY